MRCTEPSSILQFMSVPCVAPLSAVRFVVGESSLGFVLVAASDVGVCAVTLGDSPAMLARDLEKQFPSCTLVDHDVQLGHSLSTIIAFIEHPQTTLSLPLDIRGTPFQKSVWQAVVAIPHGSTASYSEIARAIGKPSAVRAVARACAENAIAVIIPCHRVVRSDGTPSGYRWGATRKQRLLERESRA